MYSKNNVLLPSKSAYSLEEACKELNLFFNRDDIDIRYILDLVHQGHIWMHAKFSKNNYLFAIPMEWELDENFNNENEKRIEEILFFNRMLNYQNIYNKMGDYDLYLKLTLETAFDLLNNKIIIKPLILDIYDPCEYFYLCDNYLKIDSGYYLEFKKYPKGLKRDEYFDTVLINHSEKEIIKKMSFFEIYDEIYNGTEFADLYYEFPEVMEIVEIQNRHATDRIDKFKWKKGWEKYYWYGDKQLEDFEMEYNLEDIYILKEDMDFLKRGESRKIRERKDYMSPHIRKQYEKLDVRSNYTSKNSISNKSINKIIYALANMANIDISQPQAAFSQLQLYCEKNNLELPNKDTCGKAFKDAKYYFDN
ncbi:hypothetical protein V0G75_003118, partial [Acinetobacter baumannii]|nr:hypothetical protein [Acinetobacter baumannii]